MEDCIFCKIVNNEIKSHTIYEDELVKVFLDANPETNGHMLIIPKKHYQNILDLDEKIIPHAVKIIKEKLYPLMKEKLHCDGMTIAQNNEYGQEVKHFHIHVVPRYENDQDYHSYNKDILISIEDIYSKLTNV
jgi:bis(5'-nucleosyl)-tetraphosphatase (symmetrical)